MKDFFFVALVYFLCDINSTFPGFSENINRLLHGKTSSTGTKDSRANLTKSHGEMFCKLNSDMEKLVASGFEELNEVNFSKGFIILIFKQ